MAVQLHIPSCGRVGVSCRKYNKLTSAIFLKRINKGVLAVVGMKFRKGTLFKDMNHSRHSGIH